MAGNDGEDDDAAQPRGFRASRDRVGDSEVDNTARQALLTRHELTRREIPRRRDARRDAGTIIPSRAAPPPHATGWIFLARDRL